MVAPLLSTQSHPAPVSLTLAVVLLLRRQPACLTLLGPRALPLGFFRFPINSLVQAALS